MKNLFAWYQIDVDGDTVEVRIHDENERHDINGKLLPKTGMYDVLLSRRIGGNNYVKLLRINPKLPFESANNYFVEVWRRTLKLIKGDE